MFNDDKLTERQKELLRQADDHADYVYMDTPDDSVRVERFLVGVNGEDTPDPAYWRARNEVITTNSEQEAIEQWKAEHDGWYCGEPISIAVFPYSEDEKPFPFGSNYRFSGDNKVEEVR